MVEGPGVPTGAQRTFVALLALSNWRKVLFGISGPFGESSIERYLHNGQDEYSYQFLFLDGSGKVRWGECLGLTLALLLLVVGSVNYSISKCLNFLFYYMS